jgi:hypothetical protein
LLGSAPDSFSSVPARRILCITFHQSVATMSSRQRHLNVNFTTPASTLRHGAVSSHNPTTYKTRSIGQYEISGTPLPAKGFF